MEFSESLYPGLVVGQSAAECWRCPWRGRVAAQIREAALPGCTDPTRAQPAFLDSCTLPSLHRVGRLTEFISRHLTVQHTPTKRRIVEGTPLYGS